MGAVRCMWPATPGHLMVLFRSRLLGQCGDLERCQWKVLECRDGTAAWRGDRGKVLRRWAAWRVFVVTF